MLNEKKFKVLYEDYLATDLTIKDYCSNISIHETTFHYWKKKLQGKLPEKNGFVPLLPAREERNGISQLPVQTGQHAQRGIDPEPVSPSFEITYPNGVKVKLNGQHSFESVQKLLLLNSMGDV